MTFSRVFPSYHPRKGEKTYFVEKVLRSLYGNKPIDNYEEILANANGGIAGKETLLSDFFFSLDWGMEHSPKHHTIRAGNRFKVGDKFSPRVWSGKPYASKQIIIAPDIEVKKVWDIKIEGYCIWINKETFSTCKINDNVERLALNDGLSSIDMHNWFNVKNAKIFSGQIICWNENINY